MKFASQPMGRLANDELLVWIVAVNIAGFIPFGYFFAAWFSLIRFTSRPRMAALFLGIAVSFLIESVQYFCRPETPA